MHSTEMSELSGFMDGQGRIASEEVHTGDCLDIVRSLVPGTFDLIYLDPPFFTKRDFSGEAREARKSGGVTSENAQADSALLALKFTDRWKGVEGGRREYLAFLEERIVRLKLLLKPTGNFLLHLDWHAVHYAKVLCDQIFGDDRFQNEIIWHYQTGGASKGRFSRKHDTILFYSNGLDFYFDGKSIAIPRTPKAMKRAQCATGARIKATDTHKNPDDVLIIPALNPMATERTGYPTQKPVELLTRLIAALCPPAGLVGDFFCGSGTTLVAAKQLGRRFVGCDVNMDAVKLARRRVETTTSAM